MSKLSPSPRSPYQNSRASSNYVTARPVILSTAKLLVVGILNLPLLRAAPTKWAPSNAFTMEDEALPAESSALWVYLAVAMGLVILGGAFAGLTIALMGQVR